MILHSSSISEFCISAFSMSMSFFCWYRYVAGHGAQTLLGIVEAFIIARLNAVR
jgi:hypothetical protein